MTSPAAAPRHYRRPLGQTLTEWGLIALLVATGGLTWLAKRGAETGQNALLESTWFYRIGIVGAYPLGGKHLLLSVELLGVAIAVLLVLQALLPQVRADVRGATVAFAMVLLLAPVLNYEPRVELLSMTTDEVQILKTDPASAAAPFTPDVFKPLLPVTYPLFGVALLVALWLLLTPAADRPPTASAFALVTALVCVTGVLLIRELLRARGQHWDFPHQLWPPLLASLWVLGQLGVAATGAAAAARDPLRSRLLAAAAAALLLVTFVITRGKP